jgi:hypothetical protein
MAGAYAAERGGPKDVEVSKVRTFRVYLTSRVKGLGFRVGVTMVLTQAFAMVEVSKVRRVRIYLTPRVWGLGFRVLAWGF